MLYSEYLNQLDNCPFCSFKDRLINQNKTAYLTYALAPYHKHHLLVIPKRHTESLSNLKRSEKRGIESLISKAMLIMKKLGYKDFTVIVREGDNTAKSIRHLHYHVIPNTHIGDLDHDGKLRRLLSQEEVNNLMNEISSLDK